MITDIVVVGINTLALACLGGAFVCLVRALAPEPRASAAEPQPLGKRGSDWPERPPWSLHHAAEHDLSWRERDDA